MDYKEMRRTTEMSLNWLRSNEFLSLMIVLGFYFICQVVRATYVSPEFDSRGDASYRWDMARALALGGAEVFDPTSHHSLRWGGWFIAYLFNSFFSDNLVYYLLAAMVPAILGGAIFTALVTRAFGFWMGLVFVMFWMVDPELYLRTYTLMPSGATFFPLSLILFSLVWFIEKESFNTKAAVFLAIVCFWAYGVKETNLFFVPGIMFVLFKSFRVKYLFVFIGAGCVLYFAESFLLWYLTSIGHGYGRLYELTLGSATHLDLMNSSRLQGELEGYYDGGASSRFYTVTAKYHVVLYFVGAYIAIANLFAKIIPLRLRVQSVLLVGSALFLSFFLVNGFFVGGAELKPLQPLRSRYLVPLIPLALVLLAAHTHQLVSVSQKWVVIPLAALMWFFVSEPVNWAVDKYAPPYNKLSAMNTNYSNFAIYMDETDCVYNNIRRHLNIIQRWPPLASRGPNFERFIAVPAQRIEDGLYVKKLVATCTRKFVMSGPGYDLYHETNNRLLTQ